MLAVLNAGMPIPFFNGSLPEGVTIPILCIVGLATWSCLLFLPLFSFLWFTVIIFLRGQSKKWKPRWYMWIVQNGLLLFSTSRRNWVYISEYNLTYKRIGVYVWLFSCYGRALHLCVKLYRRYNNWYLIAQILWCGYWRFIASSAVNWDVMITRFNLGNQPRKKWIIFICFRYRKKNLSELIQAANAKTFENMNGKSAHEYQQYYGKSYRQDYRRLLNERSRVLNMSMWIRGPAGVWAMTVFWGAWKSINEFKN